MKSKNELERLSHEKLVKLYQEKPSSTIFDLLFSQCHRELLKFLLGKRVSVENAEDLLQDYFVNEFEKSIERYEVGSKRRFINYVKHIILFRFFTLYRKEKREEEIKEFSLDEDIPNRHYDIACLTEDHICLMKEEIKDFFREIILSIKNQDHKNAIILKLCIPFKLSVEEISDLLGCTASSFSTWLYRGVLELKDKVEQSKDHIPFDFEQILTFVKEESFSIKREILEGINDSLIQEVLELYFFSKKNLSALTKEINRSEKDVKSLLRKGIFELLSLLNQRDLLFRSGGNMNIHQEDVIQFIDSLDDTSHEMTTRKSSSTGDKGLDHLLSTVYSLFHESNQESSKGSLKDNFLQRIKELDLSIDFVREKYNLSLDEINQLLTDNISENLFDKLKEFMPQSVMNSDTELEQDVVIDSKFQSMNKKMLERYYQSRRKK